VLRPDWRDGHPTSIDDEHCEPRIVINAVLTLFKTQCATLQMSDAQYRRLAGLGLPRTLRPQWTQSEPMTASNRMLPASVRVITCWNNSIFRHLPHPSSIICVVLLHSFLVKADNCGSPLYHAGRMAGISLPKAYCHNNFASLSRQNIPMAL